MEVKKNDIFVCKKNYGGFHANKFYKIKNVYKDALEIDNTTFYFEKEKYDKWLCFICPAKKTCYTKPVFKDFFYTIKEIRKEKLKKIKNI